MTIFHENLNILWGSLLIEELIRNGSNYFLISPGSRSTPLTVAVARNPGAEHSIIYDERSAAFQALGYARGTGRAAVLICTSGTAIANYMPAVVEASLDNVPLIVLSADRPPEKIETAANQTIRQSKFFGEYVRWSFDLPCPTEEIPPSLVLTTVDQLVHRSVSHPSGPVHLNCQFREPLAPLSRNISKSYLGQLEKWQQDSNPATVYHQMKKSPAREDLKQFSEIMNQSTRGLLVLGRMNPEVDYELVAQFAQRSGWPVFADILSGHRLGNHLDNLVTYFDLMLLAPDTVSRINADTIVHLGEQPASKRYLQFVDQLAPSHYILINNHPYRSDPMHRVTWRIEADMNTFLLQAIPELGTAMDKPLMNYFRESTRRLHELIDKSLCQGSALSEPAVSRLISQNIPPGHGLFLGNSLPIREMDMMGDSGCNGISIAGNRGVSGIDGTISTAVGYSRGLNKPTTAIMGDLAFLHDLNSLSQVKESDLPLILIVINNRGGGIFSFLPIAGFENVFEKFFATPHTLTFEHAARMFGIDYHLPANKADFLDIYKSLINSGSSAIIEIRTDRQENYRLHSDIFSRIISELDKLK